MKTSHTRPSKKCKALKTYTVVFAEDVPHYGSTEIEATDDAHALATAQSFDTSGLYYEGSWDSSVCKRIVSIEDSSGAPVANDIALDNYFLRNGGRTDRLLCEAASDLLEAARLALPLLELLGGSRYDKLARRASYKLLAAINKATKP
jgi:hypothetical protein